MPCFAAIILQSCFIQKKPGWRFEKHHPGRPAVDRSKLYSSDKLKNARVRSAKQTAESTTANIRLRELIGQSKVCSVRNVEGLAANLDSNSLRDGYVLDH